MMNWANNLDMLAQNGVLDYDAASHIMGQPPRYVGNPVMPSPFAGQPPVAPNIQQPEIDEFKPSKDKNDIVKLALDNNIPLQYVRSCYQDGEKHCGKCESCTRLKNALINNHDKYFIRELF